MNITYIPFTIDLYDDVYELWQTSEGVGLSGADSKENIELFLTRNPDTNIVAKSDGRIVGSCLGGFDGRRGYIHHLAVADHYRRRGIGSKLVSICLAKLQDSGAQKCHLFIYQDNRGGVEFWKSQGWFGRDELAMMSFNLQ